MVSPCSAVGGHFNYSFPEPKLSLGLTLQHHTIYIIESFVNGWKVMPPRAGERGGGGEGGGRRELSRETVI